MTGQWWNGDESGEQAGGATPPPPPPGSPDTPTTGAWSGGQAVQPPASPTSGGGRSGGGVPWPVVIAAVIALVGGLLAYNSLAGGDDDGLALEGEIFLERADEAGADPFIDEFDTLVSFDPDVVTPPNVGVASAANRPASGGGSSGGSPPLSNAEILALTFGGGEPGLYGGTGNRATCNKAALVAFLEENPEKGAAWAGAQGIQPTDIRSFVEGLTTVVLLADTRVTNHGFRNGTANPIQSVLQAGTAVMIDAEGIPRVKCGCGNPLRKPVPQTSTVVVQGEPWPEFDPAAIATVEPAEEPVDTFTLADPATGTTVERPAGTDGEADVISNGPAPRPLDDLAEAAAAAAEAAEAELESAATQGDGSDNTADDETTVEESGAVDDATEPNGDEEPEEQPPVSDPAPEDDASELPPLVLDGATYCERFQSYSDQAAQIFDLEDDGQAFLTLLRAATRDLGAIGPPEVADAWAVYREIFDRFSDAELLADISPLIEGYDAQVDAAGAVIDEHATTVCGIAN